VDSIGTLEELDALESLIAQRRAKILDKKIQAHVKATEGAYRACVDEMCESHRQEFDGETWGEYAELDDQEYDQSLKDPLMQKKLTHLAHAFVEKFGSGRVCRGRFIREGSVTVTDDVIKMVPKAVHKGGVWGDPGSGCDTEKHAYTEAMLTQYRDVVKRTTTWTEVTVKEFLDSLFTGRTLLATSLINTGTYQYSEDFVWSTSE